MRRLLLVALLVLPAWAAAQDSAAPPQPRGPRMEITVGLVELTPEVFDPGGRRVGDLDQRDFIVYDRGQRVELADFRTRRLPLFVALLVDVSASMDRSIEVLKQATGQAIENQGPGDQLVVYTLNHRLARWDQRALGRQTLLAVASGLEAKGGTRLNDALAVVLGEAREILGRKAILVLTDARGGSSLRSDEEVRQLLAASGVPVYVAVVESHDGRTLPSHDITGLARESGGRIRRVDDLAAFSAFHAQFLIDQATGYVLGFLPRPGPEGVREVEVRVRDGSLRVESRRQYVHGAVQGAEKTDAPEGARR